MSRQGTIKRYMLIIQKLEQKRLPSFADFKNMMEDEGFALSDRTLQRDMEQIRNEFGIDIKYDKANNGYFIDKESTYNFDSFLSLLEISTTSDLLVNTILEGKEVLKYVSFEYNGNLKGIDLLKTVLWAITEKQRIVFHHFNFHTEKWKDFTMEPYLLKQYQSRWYVCGKLKSKPFFILFGVDRMENLKVLEEKFTREKNFDAKDYFGSVVGITGAEGEKEEILLSISYPHAHYFKTLPLHSSQVIHADDNEKMLLGIYVVPNFELNQKILAQAEYMQVIKPQWLAEDIKKHITAMAKNYSNGKA